MAKDPVEERRRQLRALLRHETEALIDSWAKDIGSFLETAYWTRDPKRRKVHRFPSEDKRPDLYASARDREKHWITNVSKSRQVMESNLHLAEPIRDCLCWPHTVWVICSFDEDMARELVFDRIAYSVEFLPKNVRLRYQIQVRPSENRIDFFTRDGDQWASSIHAAERGVMSVRQRTPSGVILDEFGTMPNAEEMYSTALAQVQLEDDGGGTKVVGKLRMLGTIEPDSEQLQLLGRDYPEARAKAMASGQVA